MAEPASKPADGALARGGVLSPQVTVRLLQSLEAVACATMHLAAEMPRALSAITRFTETLRRSLPEGQSAPPPPAPGPRVYEVQLWHDLLWYGHVKDADASASGFTAQEVLAALRERIGRQEDLSDPDQITLVPVP